MPKSMHIVWVTVVLDTVFVLSYVFMWIISKGIHGIINEYTAEELGEQETKPSTIN